MRAFSISLATSILSGQRSRSFQLGQRLVPVAKSIPGHSRTHLTWVSPMRPRFDAGPKSRKVMVSWMQQHWITSQSQQNVEEKSPAATTAPTYNNFIDRLPAAWAPYAFLTRIDKPIGTWLLYWPCGKIPLDTILLTLLIFLSSLGSLEYNHGGHTPTGPSDQHIGNVVTFRDRCDYDAWRRVYDQRSMGPGYRWQSGTHQGTTDCIGCGDASSSHCVSRGPINRWSSHPDSTQQL